VNSILKDGLEEEFIAVMQPGALTYHLPYSSFAIHAK